MGTESRHQARQHQAVKGVNSPLNFCHQSRACAISISTPIRRTIANGQHRDYFVGKKKLSKEIIERKIGGVHGERNCVVVEWKHAIGSSTDHVTRCCLLIILSSFVNLFNYSFVTRWIAALEYSIDRWIRVG